MVSSSSSDRLLSSSVLGGCGEEVDNISRGRSLGRAGSQERRLGQGGDLGHVVSARAAGCQLVEAEDLVEELVGGGLAGRGGQVVVGDLGGAGDKGGDGHEDTKGGLDALLGLEDLCEGDGEGDLGVNRRGGGLGLLGGGSGGLLLRRDLDVAQVEVGHLDGAVHDLGGSFGVDGAQVGEDVTLEEAAVGARGLDLVDGVLVEAVAVDEGLDGGEEWVSLLAGLGAGSLGRAALLLRGGRRRRGTVALGCWLLGGGGGLRGGGVVFSGNLERGEVVTGLGDDGDTGADLDGLGAVTGGDLEHDAVVLSLDVHGGLIRLDLEEHVAGGEGFALLDLPAGDATLRHGWGEGRHGEVLGREASC